MSEARHTQTVDADTDTSNDENENGCVYRARVKNEVRVTSTRVIVMTCVFGCANARKRAKLMLGERTNSTVVQETL